MADDIDEALSRRAADLERLGRDKYGEKHWGLALGGLKRACASVGVNPAEAVKAALAQGDAEALLYNVGREALIREASDGNHDSEAAYSDMRRAEREAHFARKGRVY